MRDGSWLALALGIAATACSAHVDAAAIDAGPPGDAGPDVTPGDATAGTADATAPALDAGVLSDDAETSDAAVPLDAMACVPPAGIDAGACWAACCVPAGMVERLTSAQSIYAAMEGRWLFCSPGDWHEGGVPADTIGVEFGPAVVGDASCGVTGGGGNCGGGAMRFLVQGPTGPVPGSGFGYGWTYDIDPTYLQINVHPGPNSGGAIGLRYSPCPTEIEIDDFVSDHPRTVLVPAY
jgi:hypothetical protein